MSDFKTGMMTRALNGIKALDNVGWGRSGAAAGAALGGTVGMFSDDTSMMGGAFKGAIMGGIGGKGLRFGSKFLRDEAGMAAYESTSMMNKFFPDGYEAAFQKSQDVGAAIAEHTSKLRATAVGS